MASLTSNTSPLLLERHKQVKTKNDLFIAINKLGKNEIAEDAAYLLGCELLTDKESNSFESFKADHIRKMRIIPKKLLTNIK